MAQNKISRRSFLRGAGASATIAAASCMAPSAAACDIKSLWSMDLQILATSDTHGKFDPWDYAANKADASGSVAQQATAIKENRTKTTLVVDAGDTIQANSAELFLNDDVHPMIAAQNAIGYDVYVTGNHEYNYGMATLEKVPMATVPDMMPRSSPAIWRHCSAWATISRSDGSRRRHSLVGTTPSLLRRSRGKPISLSSAAIMRLTPEMV